jgi:NAD(P)-dependent dehydrogenase (short-subunit alcohol dehydrogenase family)
MVAVVTGAASGIGRALVDSFVIDGAAVAMADVDADRLGEEADHLRGGGATVLDMAVDVGDAGSVEELARRTAERFGRVDVLCNNAGTITFGPVWEIDLAEWDRVLRVNLLSVVHAARSFVPLLRESGDDGAIVNVASMAAFMQFGGVAPYIASKHGLVGLSIALAEDLRTSGSGITVSVACPDMVATRFGNPEAVLPAEADLPAGILSPAQAAAAIRAGMAAGRFYIYTHAASEATVRDRFRRALDGYSPSESSDPGA